MEKNYECHQHHHSRQPLLFVSNLTLKHHGSHGLTTILHDVSLELHSGEILGLIGESGAGKSTLGNAVLGLLAPGFLQTGGQVVFEGRALEELNGSDRAMIRGRRISAIFQDPSSSLDPLMCVGMQIAETVRTLDSNLTASQAKKRASELLARVGIPDPDLRYGHYPHQFSGGQRQRIVIAIALAGRPDIIVADEPTSALDATVQKQILALLRTLTDETGVSVILVTHDMGVIAEIADRVVVMRHGRVVEQGKTASILDGPAESYTRDLLRAVPRLRLNSGSSRPHRVAARDTVSGSGDDRTEPYLKPILSVKGVTKTFARHGLLPKLSRNQPSPALKDVSIELSRGTITGIIGESGSGKSTIGRIIAGLKTASGGNLEIEGVPYDINRPGRRSGLLGKVQMIFQDPSTSLNPHLTIGSTLDESARPGRHESRARRDVGEMMERLGLSRSLLKNLPHQLSGGQKQRVCIARALLADPSIIVADEPTSALDVSVQAEIVKLLKETVSERGVSMLFISHDLALVQDLCHSIYIFKDGVVEDFGAADFIFSQSENPYTRRLIDARPGRFTDLNSATHQPSPEGPRTICRPQSSFSLQETNHHAS